MRTLQELVNTEEPAWDFMKSWFDEASNHYQILERNPQRAETEIVRTQVTTRSPMGAIVYHTGGILIDHGWMRILGSGHRLLDRGLMEWNMGRTIQTYGQQMGLLLVADDVLGGLFAINGGALGDDFGKLYYWAPDSMEWEQMDIGYSGFVQWALSGDLQLFYEHFRWENWQEDTSLVDGNQCFSFVPPLWTVEGKTPTKDTSRWIVPLAEHYKLYLGTTG